MNPVVARLLARVGLSRSDSLCISVPEERVRIEAALLVGRLDGDREPVPFLIDSGCSVTTMDLGVARGYGLSTDGRRVQKRQIAATGRRTLTVVRGSLQFWLSAEQRAAPFVVPVEFEEGRATEAPNLFGLKGVIDQMRWAIGPSRPRAEGVLGRCVLSDARRAADRFPS